LPASSRATIPLLFVFTSRAPLTCAIETAPELLEARTSPPILVNVSEEELVRASTRPSTEAMVIAPESLSAMTAVPRGTRTRYATVTARRSSASSGGRSVTVPFSESIGGRSLTRLASSTALAGTLKPMRTVAVPVTTTRPG
jgi:hypothetical protein